MCRERSRYQLALVVKTCFEIVRIWPRGLWLTNKLHFSMVSPPTVEERFDLVVRRVDRLSEWVASILQSDANVKTCSHVLPLKVNTRTRGKTLIYRWEKCHTVCNTDHKSFIFRCWRREGDSKKSYDPLWSTTFGTPCNEPWGLFLIPKASSFTVSVGWSSASNEL